MLGSTSVCVCVCVCVCVRHSFFTRCIFIRCIASNRAPSAPSLPNDTSSTISFRHDRVCRTPTMASEEENDVPTFSKCNAWDVSALLSMTVRTDVQPAGETWDDLVTSIHDITVAILREMRRLSTRLPYKTIPYSNPPNLIPYIVAMKTQYTIQGSVCGVRVGRCKGRFGVFATDDLKTGNVVTVVPVDAIFLKQYGGMLLSPDNTNIDPATIRLRNTRFDDIFIASSLLYFCPERCGHLIHHDMDSNAMLHDLLGGVFNFVQLTRDVASGEELLFPIHSP